MQKTEEAKVRTVVTLRIVAGFIVLVMTIIALFAPLITISSGLKYSSNKERRENTNKKFENYIETVSASKLLYAESISDLGIFDAKAKECSNILSKFTEDSDETVYMNTSIAELFINLYFSLKICQNVAIIDNLESGHSSSTHEERLQFYSKNFFEFNESSFELSIPLYMILSIFENTQCDVDSSLFEFLGIIGTVIFLIIVLCFLILLYKFFSLIINLIKLSSALMIRQICYIEKLTGYYRQHHLYLRYPFFLILFLVANTPHLL